MTNNVPEHEWDNKLGKTKREPLPLLPELEMLEAEITDVAFQFSMFNGKQQYVSNYETKEMIYDEKGQPIPRKEFNITFSIKGHSLTNGNPRKAWLKVGASLSEKSKLSKLLKILMISAVEPSAKDIINALTGTKVRFQLVNKPGKDGQIYQNINFESIRCVVDKRVQSLIDKATGNGIQPEDIVWSD